jgi:hypothetical protein
MLYYIHKCLPPVRILSQLNPVHTLTSHFLKIHLLDFITRTILGTEYRSLSCLMCSFLHSLDTLSLLGLNILTNTLFSNTLSLHSPLNVNDLPHFPYAVVNWWWTVGSNLMQTTINFWQKLTILLWLQVLVFTLHILSHYVIQNIGNCSTEDRRLNTNICR